jgi:peptide/nickel transport system permease protein
MAGAVVLAIIYFVAVFADFLSPYDPNTYDSDYIHAPPQFPRFVSEDGFQIRPFVYDYTLERDPETLRRRYVFDRDERIPVRFFVTGYEYRLFGLIPSRVHLFGPERGRLYLFGSDRLGRDVFSRTMAGTRISATIGLIGVAMSLFLGVLIGGFSGLIGGKVDSFVQRFIEFLRSIPTLPLWMALSAALPPDWTPIQRYISITVILSLVGWTGLARVVRSKFLSLREEDFVTAARFAGLSNRKVIFRHMVPSFLSHIIASITLAIPRMIIGETSLSFIGLGLQPPTVSWGVLLQEAQNIRSVAHHPWLFIPGLFVIVTVLAFNFLGDGMRDAADPYSTS